MRVYKDKTNSLWKLNPKGVGQYETKEQAQRAWLDEMASKLTQARKRYEEGVLGYGR